ncbi:MAG: hypothetical protein MUP09_11850, partial [Thiovulaceae bacterium]|nr:hypothetical protein [Sulfurimonadaceae bacterium]
QYRLFTKAGYHSAMKYLMILMLAFAMSFSALSSALTAKGDLPVTQCVESGTDAAESCDAEEPNSPSDESKHFVVRPLYVNSCVMPSFQRVSFHYLNEEDLSLNKPPQV